MLTVLLAGGLGCADLRILEANDGPGRYTRRARTNAALAMNARGLRAAGFVSGPGISFNESSRRFFGFAELKKAQARLGIAGGRDSSIREEWAQIWCRGFLGRGAWQLNSKSPDLR